MIIQIILLAVGFVLMMKGADVFVDSSVNISAKLKIPTVIVGLTIVAAGTSAPEAVVSITASVKGANALAISNAVGSNIFNLLLV
ncbi:MAG: sodium:calcium antiporter, partial [Oscillospiraceae bacterium]|nr:sodium:calcium antiporter [Oscillospiraceae bacterium]